MDKKRGFTLVELLVVIAIIALLMAILMPALSRVREQGMRAVCLHNCNNLTLAWYMYADENDDKIVNGAGGFHYTKTNKTSDGSAGGIVERAWVGKGWGKNWNNKNFMDSGLTDDDKKKAIREGALWPLASEYDIYKCPTGRSGDFVTYAVVDAMNGLPRNGTSKGGHHPYNSGERVGKTMLWVKRRSQISNPPPAKRMVFVDEGAMTPDSFATHYRQGPWWDDPPARHGAGTVVSFADTHAEHIKWRAAETIEHSLKYQDYYAGGNFKPNTPEGKKELDNFRRLVWGRLGYVP